MSAIGTNSLIPLLLHTFASMPRQDLVHHGILADPYTDCAFFQCLSSELVIYSPTAGQHVEIAWPTTTEGRPIMPSGIKNWLYSHGLHWPCFCSLTEEDSLSSWIVKALNGDVFILQFIIKFDVTPKYCHSLLKLSKPPDHCTLPSMGTIVSNFLHDAAAVRGPYFRGFCREHLIDYPGVIQLAGAPLAMWQLSTAQVSRHGLSLSASGFPYSHFRQAGAHTQGEDDGDEFFGHVSAPLFTHSKAWTRIVCKKVHPSEVLIGMAAGEATSGSSNAIAGPSLLSSEQAGSDRKTISQI
ncbi:hypothetical protein CPB84DRAFT_1748791 [Gymnopilus junonius]|uniref:Uncharacterized protein n=1 Tax=Gymnopilus junonius TaxID=109634 RepID=A0A9P5NK55_GYMJU|nr:hypothetical protein CPB84DRAFT_1748791 [Gymnopilus junonius]